MANEQWDKVVDKDKIEANEVTTATIHATSTGNEWVSVLSAHKEKKAS